MAGAVSEPARDAAAAAVAAAAVAVAVAAAAQAAAESAARSNYGRLVAFLSTRTHDVAGAEDALADAFEAALREWPVNSVP